MIRKRRIKIIYNKQVIKYLANYKVYPLEEFDDCAYYYESVQLSSLLGRFELEKYVIPNKL